MTGDEAVKTEDWLRRQLAIDVEREVVAGAAAAALGFNPTVDAGRADLPFEAEPSGFTAAFRRIERRIDDDDR